MSVFAACISWHGSHSPVIFPTGTDGAQIAKTTKLWENTGQDSGVQKCSCNHRSTVHHRN